MKNFDDDLRRQLLYLRLHAEEEKVEYLCFFCWLTNATFREIHVRYESLEKVHALVLHFTPESLYMFVVLIVLTIELQPEWMAPEVLRNEPSNEK